MDQHVLQSANRSPKTEDLPHTIDQLWQRITDIDARLSRVINLLNNNVSINRLLKASEKINGHSSEMPDHRGTNSDHDQRYYTRKVIDKIVANLQTQIDALGP